MAFTQEIDGLKKQIDDLKRKYEARKGEIRLESQTTVQPDINRLNKEKTDLEHRMRAMQDEFNGKLHGLIVERDSLKRHLADFEAKYRAHHDLLLKERNMERSKLESTIKALQAENTTLKGGAQGRIHDLEKQIHSLHSQLEAEKKQNLALEATITKEREELNRELNLLRTNNNELDKKREAVAGHYHDDIVKLRKEKNDKEEVMRTEIRELKASNNELKKALARAEKLKADALKEQTQATLEVDRLRDFIDRNGKQLPFQSLI